MGDQPGEVTPPVSVDAYIGLNCGRWYRAPGLLTHVPPVLRLWLQVEYPSGYRRWAGFRLDGGIAGHYTRFQQFGWHGSRDPRIREVPEWWVQWDWATGRPVARTKPREGGKAVNIHFEGWDGLRTEHAR